MTRAYLGIGSNLGDRAAHLTAAVEALRVESGVASVRLSPVYETAPVGPVAQGDFLNAAIELDTVLVPEVLLAVMGRIEADAGRAGLETRQRWGPRVLDLDLLLYGDRVIDRPGLSVPHPRMHERGFVLRPLADLAPEAVHPKLGRTIADLLDQVDAGGG